MSLTNISQLLIRNQDLLATTHPLLVNMPDDSFAKELLQLNATCQLAFFDTNYANHLAHKKIASDKHSAIFASHYVSSVKHDLIIISFPKSKKELAYTIAMLNPIISDTTRVLIVGENNGGIRSLAKTGKSIFSYCEKIDSARHCLLFDVTIIPKKTSFAVEDWFEYYTVTINQDTVQVAALPGVFSQAKLDVGTQVLLENLPNFDNGNMLDFGCGAGVIAAFIGKRTTNLTLDLADVSALALASAKKTLSLNQLQGKVFPTNSLSDINEQYQFVISNPPFHQGIKTHYQATEDFLSGISGKITANGSLTIVANSFLKYQPLMEKNFNQVTKIHQEKGFSIYHAIKRSKP
ncbi:methyltransferase [Thalassotalea piscium]